MLPRRLKKRVAARMIITAAAIKPRPAGDVRNEARSDPPPPPPLLLLMVTVFFTVWTCPVLSVIVRVTLKVPEEL